MKWILRSALAAVLATSSLYAAAAPSSAACNLNPTSGSGLQAAVECLNTEPGGAGSTIRLNGNIYYLTGPLRPMVPMSIRGFGELVNPPSQSHIVMSNQPLDLDTVHMTLSNAGGGGIDNSAGGDLTFSHGDVRSLGAATNSFITMTGGNLTVLASSFTGLASSTAGGVISMTGGNLAISASTFGSNTSSVKGGAIDYSGSGAVSITSTSFSGNVSQTGGGAISSAGATFTLTNVNFQSNRTLGTGAPGGALWLTGGLNATRVRAQSNTASGQGGAFFIENSGELVSIDRSTFDSNTATVGGAVRLGTSTGVGRVTNATFIGNKATGPGTGGGAISVNVPTTISGSTFRANTADSKQGSTFFVAGDIELKGSIVSQGAANASTCINTPNSFTTTNVLVDDGCLSGKTGTTQTSDLRFKGGATPGLETPPSGVGVLPLKWSSPAVRYNGFTNAAGCPVADANAIARPGTSGTTFCTLGSSEYTSTMTQAPLTSSGQLTAQQSVEVNATGTDVRLLDNTGAWVSTSAQSLTVPNKGTFNVVAGSPIKITFDPLAGFTGDVSVPFVVANDPANDAAWSTYTATVKPAPPTSQTRTSNGAGTTEQSITETLEAGQSIVLLDAAAPDADNSITVADKGTFVLNPTTGKITFTPVLGFSGTATVNYRVADGFAQQADSTYTATVTKPAAPAVQTLTSTGVSPDVQSATVAKGTGESVALLDGSTVDADNSLTVADKGTFVLNPTTGVITFTPLRWFAGTATVGVRVTDAYGQTTDSSYAATVTKPAGPQAKPLTSNGAGTAEQTATATPGANETIALLDGAVADADNAITLAGKGIFTLAPATGAITFSPELGFAGTAEVAYRITDGYGQTSDSTYVATVTKPAAPTVQTLTSTGASPQPQTATAAKSSGSTVALLDGAAVDADNSLTMADKGTFVLNPATGVITFTPLRWFAGTATVGVRVTDAYGQATDSSYAATVTAPAAPKPKALTSTGVGPAEQKVTASLVEGDDLALLHSDKSLADSVVVAGKGTFVVNPDTGLITFAPVVGFSGEAVVGYRIVDGYGQSADATYTATVTKPAAPSVPAVTVTSGTSGTVVVPPGGTVALLTSTQGTGTTVTVAGQGTFTLNPATGVITFAPVAGFTGEASVPVRITDAYGQAVVGAFKVAIKASPSAVPTPTVKPTVLPVPSPTSTPTLGWSKPASWGLPHVATTADPGAYLGVVGERWRFSLKSADSQRVGVYKVVVTADKGSLSKLSRLSLEPSDKVRVSGRRIVMSLRTSGGRDAVEFFTGADAMKLTVRVTRNGKPVSGSFVRLGSRFEAAGANPVTIARVLR